MYQSQAAAACLGDPGEVAYEIEAWGPPPPPPIHFCPASRCVPRITVHLLIASHLQEATSRAVSNDRRQRGSWFGSEVLSRQTGEFAAFSSSSGDAWGSAHHHPGAPGRGTGHYRLFLTSHCSLLPGTLLETLANPRSGSLLGFVGTLLRFSKWEASVVGRYLVLRFV